MALPDAAASMSIEHLLDEHRDSYLEDAERHDAIRAEILRRFAERKMVFAGVIPVCDACGWKGDIVPTQDESSRIVRAHLVTCPLYRNEVDRAISDRGVAERDCSLPIGERVANIIGELKQWRHECATEAMENEKLRAEVDRLTKDRDDRRDYYGRRIAAFRAEVASLTKQRDAAQERVDLDIDEFKRIKAELFNSFDGIGVTEAQRMTARLVYGLCDRAMAAGRQRVPLIEQRDLYERERNEAIVAADRLAKECARLRAELEQQRTRAEAAEDEIRHPSVLTDRAQEAGNG